MGGTSNKERQPKPAQETSFQELQQLQNAKQISSRLYQTTKSIYNHCIEQQFLELATDFKILTYDFSECYLPLCLKKTKGYYLCRTCYSDEVCICEGCFQVHKHSNHQYVLIETEYTRICSCGNREIIAEPPTCEAHKLASFEEHMNNEQTTELFRKQLGYLLKLALPLAQGHAQVSVSEQFRSSFVFNLLTFLKSTIMNNNIAAELVENMLFEVSQFSSEGFTVLEELLSSQTVQKNKSLIADILTVIAKSSCKKDRLTNLYFKWLFSKQSNSVAVLRVVQSSGFKPSLFPITYQRYFEKPQNCRFYLQSFNKTVQKEDFVCQKYDKFGAQLGEILLHSNSYRLLLQIFQNTKFTELLNIESYYLLNNQTNNRINKVNLKLTLFAFKAIRVLAQTEMGAALLQLNLNDIYLKISNKQKSTFDRSLQRTFSFIVFTLFKFRIPKKNELQKVLGAQVDVASAKNIISQSIDFKTSFKAQSCGLIAKGEMMKLQGKLSFPSAELLAADQLLLKIFSNCLPSNIILGEYIGQKLGKSCHKEELTPRKIAQPLIKLNEFFQTFEVPQQNNMAELILASNSSQQGNSSEIVLYNILIGCQNILSAKFKAMADRFIASQQKVIDFIKNYTVIQNKKIKTKPNSNIPILPLSPDSVYFFENLENQVVQKLIQYQINRKELTQSYQAIFNAHSLQPCINFWQNCSKAVQNNDFDVKRGSKYLNQSVSTLCSLFIATKLPVLKQLIQVFSDKLPSPNSKTQTYLKYTLQTKNGEEKDKQRHTSEKKKQMLIALKQKQKNALLNFKLQEKCNIDLECIFCKNSIEGDPYLLGHFKYNNFYSQKILQVDAPFMEFTTCGHSAHEKCLIQMHKGDFKIWYPCILCKSISNILLPIANAQLNQEKRLDKILDFLKNFAANYTFFLESNKQLVEFDLNDIIGVYKLLFKTMAYSLTIYPIANFAYFQRSQLPILKFIFDLLLFSCKKLRNLSLVGQKLELKANNHFTNIFNYHKYQLQAFITGNQHNLPLQRKIDLHRDHIPEELTLLFDQIYEYLTDERDRIDYEPKQVPFKDGIIASVFRLPEDLKYLRKMMPKCNNCSNIDQTFQICILCEWSCCSLCKDKRKVHALQNHVGQTVFVSGYNGKYTYVHEQLTGDFSSIYEDYLGYQASDKKLIEVQEFMISESRWTKIVNDVICNRLHKEIMRVNG